MTIQEISDKFTLVKAYNQATITVLNKNADKIVGFIWGNDFRGKDIIIHTPEEYKKLFGNKCSSTN